MNSLVLRTKTSSVTGGTMKPVIMAGGKGTRIASVTTEVPKPMILVDDKPILQHQIECLCGQGLTDITIVIGHLGHIIQRYFGDGSRFGTSLTYVVESEPLGTAGALGLLDTASDADVLLINGDTIFDVDFSRFEHFHQEHDGLASVLTHPNDHPYDSAVLQIDSTQRVTRWLAKDDERCWFQNRVNAGIHLLRPALLQELGETRRRDLDRDVLKPLVERGRLFAYDSPEYVKDMGTPDRLAAVTADVRAGRVARRNLTNPQQAVFLDRDGTINRDVGFLTDVAQLELIDGVGEFISAVNQAGYLAIVVTNQPVIARGDVTWDGLREIHNKMETLLGEYGAFVNDIFICPHHPNSGFVGERSEYKIVCDCRKPRPGLLIAAAEKYNIDLTASVMVGDTDRDAGAAAAAGCSFVKVGSGVPYPSLDELAALMS